MADQTLQADTKQQQTAIPTADSLEQVRRDINALLSKEFAGRISQATTMSPDYDRLWRVLSELGQAGGKRFRPYMVLLAYRAFSGQEPQRMLPVAASWELLHLCMLVHDDIIDRDYVHYGVANVAGTYRELYRPQTTDPSQLDHYAMSAALLAGDLALSMAHELVLRSDLPAEQKITASSSLTAATFTVAGGELLDTEAALLPMLRADPRLVARFKTASYSFIGPLTCGAQLAGASQDELDKLTQFGDALGHAFQLADDLLGIYGDPEVTGKSACGDISEGKRTYLMQQAFRRSSPADVAQLELLVGKADLTTAEAGIVRDIIIRSGAKADTEALIADYADRAEQIIAALPVAAACLEELRNLVVIATRRNR